MTTSLTSILQTPQAFPLEQILGQKGGYMNRLIDYISVRPDPFLMNERECYYYPLKAVEIFNSVGVYRQLVMKQERKDVDGTKIGVRREEEEDSQYEYPYLERLFKNLKDIQSEEILLGYVDIVLYSLTKKTPEIYQYFKDNQQSLLFLLQNDHTLFAMRDFLTLFLTQSTMMLYVFLKNMILRTLMFRIVQNQSTPPIVYEMICEFYTELLKAYVMQTNQEDRDEILEVLKNIQEENFVALLALKISSQHHRRTYFIAKILNQIAGSPNNVYQLVVPYIDTYTEYMESYEESENFMLLIMPDQLMMLRLILRICAVQKQALNDIKEESIKRLLVYSNIHQKNTIVHNMLFALIQVLEQQGNKKLLTKAKIIEFLKNNLKPSTSFNFKGLVKRICLFFSQKQLDSLVESQQEKQFLLFYTNQRKQKLEKTSFFKEKKNESQLFQGNLSTFIQNVENKSENDSSADQK